jgi:hypothetical protein
MMLLVLVESIFSLWPFACLSTLADGFTRFTGRVTGPSSMWNTKIFYQGNRSCTEVKTLQWFNLKWSKPKRFDMFLPSWRCFRMLTSIAKINRHFRKLASPHIFNEVRVPRCDRLPAMFDCFGPHLSQITYAPLIISSLKYCV